MAAAEVHVLTRPVAHPGAIAVAPGVTAVADVCTPVVRTRVAHWLHARFGDEPEAAAAAEGALAPVVRVLWSRPPAAGSECQDAEAEQALLSGHALPVSALAFFPEERAPVLLCSCSADSLFFWSLQELRRDCAAAAAAALATAAAGSATAPEPRVSSGVGRFVDWAELDTPAPHSLCFDASGTFVAACSGRRVLVLRVDTAKLEAILDGHAGTVHMVAARGCFLRGRWRRGRAVCRRASLLAPRGRSVWSASVPTVRSSCGTSRRAHCCTGCVLRACPNRVDCTAARLAVHRTLCASLDGCVHVGHLAVRRGVAGRPALSLRCRWRCAGACMLL